MFKNDQLKSELRQNAMRMPSRRTTQPNKMQCTVANCQQYGALNTGFGKFDAYNNPQNCF